MAVLQGSPIIVQRLAIHPPQWYQRQEYLICTWSEAQTWLSSLGQVDPQGPEGSRLRQVRIEPYHDQNSCVPPNEAGLPSMALVTLEYGLPEIDIGQDNNLFQYREELIPSFEVIPIEADNVVFESGQPLTLSQRPSITVPTPELQCTRISHLGPSAAMLTLWGCVNSGPLQLRQLGTIGPKRAKYTGCSVRAVYAQAGTARWTVTAHFQLHPVNWQKMYNARTGAWELLVDRLTNLPIQLYPEADLNAVLP
ncbi:MAG: hypothetical protein NZ821_06015 [Gloeomargarita sp. SKYB31]|nr:hypothetical protein [Gloeomargarita sp. SKYB31]